MLSFRYEPLPSDREIVRRIVAGTGFFNQVEIDCAVELVDERLAKGLPSGYEFVFAHRGDAVVGYACYGQIPLTQGSYDLYWIAVDQAEQGQGLGRKILEESERLIRRDGGRNVYIETSGRPDYASTQGFYTRCGYLREAVLKGFYAPGDDKLIYSKTLD